MKYFAGLDWGGTAHAICVVNQTGRIIMQSEVRHDAQGLESLRRQLNKIAPAGAIPIAIERPSGLIVDTLVADGYSVIPIHPNVVKACRPRYSVAGGKHDRGDAYLLADVLRTDGHRFCPLTPASDEVKALRCLVRTRHALIAERLALLNQLHALLGSSGLELLRCFTTSIRRLAWLSLSAIPRRAAPLVSERSVLPPSLKHRDIAGDMALLNFWRACVPRLWVVSVSWKSRQKAESYLQSRAFWVRCERKFPISRTTSRVKSKNWRTGF
jgi:predicted CoA-binding protein